MKMPDSVWRSYLSEIKSQIIAEWRKLTIEFIIDKLSAIERQVEADRPQGMRADAWPDELGTQFDILSEKYDLLSEQSKNIAAGAFGTINKLSHRQWYQTAKQVLGVDLFQFEPWIQNESKAFITENVGLIKKTGDDVLHDVKRIVMTGFRQGKRWETLRYEILTGTDLEPGTFNKVETRAKVIARDQSTKLYGNLNEKRQTSAGLELYTWRTVEDERVRGTPSGKYPNAHPSHYLMDGKVCRWNNATVYADSVKEALAGKWKKRIELMPKVHPGQAIQCRCYAEPVFETLFQ